MRAFESGKEGWAAAGWPVAPPLLPKSRSWPAVQFFAGRTFLHIGTDEDVGGDGHIIALDLANGAIFHEYTPLPGSHVRGGMQLLDDPAFASDARLYATSFEDTAGGNQDSVFSIITDDVDPDNYTNQWRAPLNPSVPDPPGGGDVDMYVTFDGGQLYVGDSDGIFYGLNRTTGVRNWFRDFQSDPDLGGPLLPPETSKIPIRSSPVSYVNRRGAGELYVGNDNGKVFQIDPANGNILQTHRLGNGRKIRSLSIVDDDSTSTTYLVAITSDGYVFLIKVS